MNNINELTAKTKELIHLMTDRISMNPVSCKLLNEAWKETFPDEEAVAKYMAVLLEKLEVAEMRNAELATECAVLKKAIPPLKMINVDNNSWDDVSIAEDIGFNQAISAILRNLPQTPATDRFLAEQRAMGVEKCASVIQQQVWDESEGDGIVAALDAMEIYADQLRNEVKKI